MKYFLYLILYSLVFYKHAALSQAVFPWETLFNGKDLSGWTIVGGNGKVVVEDGLITLYRAANSLDHTYLRSNKKYKDFILEFDAKRESDSFFGVVFRAKNAPDTARAPLFGYQVKADHRADRGWTGGIFDDFGTSWNWMYTPSQETIDKKALKPAGEWDHYHIEAVGDQIRVWVNAIPITNMKNDKYKKGYIAFKIHFMGDLKHKEPIATWIRDIKVITKNVSEYTLEMPLELKVVK